MHISLTFGNNAGVRWRQTIQPGSVASQQCQSIGADQSSPE